jgi:5-methylcytosine-specific restriction endonuclease McrA
MKKTLGKISPSRLDPKSYRKLPRQILERDGWRCQNCGSMQNLQVHHQEFRSHSGNDEEQNLITLCAGCHAQVHRNSLTSGISGDRQQPTRLL